MMLCASHSEHRLYLRVQLSKKYCCVQDSPIGDGALQEGAQRLIVKVLTLVLCLYNSIPQQVNLYSSLHLKTTLFQQNREHNHTFNTLPCSSVKGFFFLVLLWATKRGTCCKVQIVLKGSLCCTLRLPHRIVKGFFFQNLFWATKRGTLFTFFLCQTARAVGLTLIGVISCVCYFGQSAFQLYS